MSDVQNLINRLADGERSNKLDVLVECAVFTPDKVDVSCRPNAAGTKVIYTSATGGKSTFWARDWSMSPVHAIAELRRVSQ